MLRIKLFRAHMNLNTLKFNSEINKWKQMRGLNLFGLKAQKLTGGLVIRERNGLLLDGVLIRFRFLIFSAFWPPKQVPTQDPELDRISATTRESTTAHSEPSSSAPVPPIGGRPTRTAPCRRRTTGWAPVRRKIRRHTTSSSVCSCTSRSTRPRTPAAARRRGATRRT